MFSFKIFTAYILVFILFLHKGFSPYVKVMPTAEERVKIISECLKEIEEEFTEYPDPVIHARHAVLNIKVGASCLKDKKYLTEYYDSFYQHLISAKVPSIIDFCKGERVPKNDRDGCIETIVKLFKNAYTHSKFDVKNKLDLLRTAFYQLDIKDAKLTENAHAIEYMQVISISVQLDVDPKGNDPKKFHPPEHFCEEISKRKLPLYTTAESSSNPTN